MAKSPDTPTSDGKSARGRYRKVEVKMWGDEKFRRLSPLPPCGQGLWLFLITGPHTGPIPGLFRAGRAALAEELGWDMEGFDKAFGEAFREGMVEADFRARVVWLPNAFRHNRPESPNVVRSWRAEFELIPECLLKQQALESLRSSVYALGEAFAKAFDEAFGKPSGKAFEKPYPKAMANQEQEQEQEQEKALSTAGAVEGTFPETNGQDLLGDQAPPAGKRSIIPVQKVVDLYHELLPKHPRVEKITAVRRGQIQQRWREDLPNLQAWRNYFTDVSKSAFLTGRVPGRDGKPPFVADLEWLTKQSSFAKVAEGKYHTRSTP